MRRLLFVAALSVGFGHPALAQQDTPEAVVGQIVAASRANDWGRMAALMHPTAVHQLRVLLDPVLRMEGPSLDTVRQMLFGFTSVAAATAATDSAVLVGLMRFAMSQQPKVAEALRSSSYRVLGSVPEGPDTTHVVGRISMSFDGTPVSQIEVTSLMRSGTTWRAMLKSDLTAMASRLRAALTKAP